MIKNIIDRLSSKQKTSIVMTYDVVLISLTFLISFQLRLNQFFLERELFLNVLKQIIVIIPIQLICFYIMGLYKGIWRYSSTADLSRIVRGVTLSIPFSFLLLFIFNRLEFTPRSIFFIQWALLIIGIGGGRFAYRLYRDSLLEKGNKNYKRTRKTLIIGAGYAAQLLIRDIKSDVRSDINIVGLLDDDINKRGKILHGFKVLGAVSDVSQLAKRHNITEVIIAIPSATKDELTHMISYFSGTNIKVKTIPKLGDIISGKVQITKLRKVTPSDLLGRDQVKLNMNSVSSMITNEVIFVTGAGGSIGSELAIQIEKLKPAKLICIDISELNLYNLGFRFEKVKSDTKIDYVIADIKDKSRLDVLFQKYRPNILFHAAAYKHVPMMELNPFEAIKVNVFGTKNLVEISKKYQLEKFVLISTDKAVNPTNVMGTTKRIAEMICQHAQVGSRTIFNMVRFGNVLGSSGSVIPRFQKQIEQGGPVTVTHPDIIRYFMSIPEAAQLVIQAGSLGKGGEIFVLDMGDPVKIYDLAKQMITLAGLNIGEDIEIKFTGLRPGEKLFEELLTDTEVTKPTVHERVKVAKEERVQASLEEKLKKLLNKDEMLCIRKILQEIVPEYKIPESQIDKDKSFF
ncbi:MAG: hypothetical protein CME62_08890 [Halobacteriovoraceae bacterium]|nr:hypothetical protein [Halobacteriovoraceae bacterium]|tara:strand:- start:2951 stop:4834 length:1884 start_codon:yes stop_codon:yes gene_type:complete